VEIDKYLTNLCSIGVFRSFLLLMTLAVTLTDCGLSDAIRQKWAEADDAKCRSYGATPGSPAYVQCRSQLDAARTQALAE
jgi:hypothetical protein